MKIYPSSHGIGLSTAPDKDKDIVLAYINYDTYDIICDYYPNVLLSETYNSLIYPYKSYKSSNVTLFKNKTIPIDSTDCFKKVNDTYYYLAPNTIEFIPEQFEFKIYAFRNLIYSPQKTYNIRAGCITNLLDNANIGKNIINIAADTNNTYAPINVAINNKDSDINSLTGLDIEGADIMFVETSNGSTIKNTNIELNLEDFYNVCSNVFISVDDNSDMICDSESILSIKNPILYDSELKINTLNNISTDYFDESVWSNLSRDIYETESSSYPVHVLQNKETRAVVIYAHKSFFNNLLIADNGKALYEILTRTYLSSYIVSGTNTSYISDTVPDYTVSRNTLQKLDGIKSSKKLKDYFYEDIAYYDNEGITLLKIITNKESIVASSLLNGYITFKRTNSIKKDPLKENGMISVLTDKGIISYTPNNVYEMQDNISDCVSYSISKDTIAILIQPYKSSINGIHIENYNELSIPLYTTINEEYTEIKEGYFKIYIKNGIIDYIFNDNIPFNSFELFKLDIKQKKSEPVVVDLRVKGGGSKIKDYNLMNHSNINGRPYRRGGTSIITLPIKYEKYKDVLLSEINRYKSAEEYSILNFEE